MKSSKTALKICILALIFISLAFTAYAAGATNVTILYGWNGTEFAPVQLDGQGALKTTLNLTESIGMFPRDDSLYDIGKTNLRWRSGYFANITSDGHINVTGRSSNSTFNGDVRILGTLYGGSPLKIGGGINISGLASGEDAFFVSNSAGEKIFRIGETGKLNITTSAGNFSVDDGTLLVDITNNLVGIGTLIPYNALTVVGSASVSGTLNASSVNTTGNAYFAVNSGRVGIGAISPNVTFHVSGNANITGTLSTGSFEIQNAGAGTMNISGQTLLATDAGNVGIGNRNPNVTLHVSGRANITGYLEVGKGLNVSNGMNLISGSLGVGTVSPYNSLVVVGSVGVSGSLNASSINTTGGAYFATASGNVGIGTTAPTEKLVVVGNATIQDSIRAYGFVNFTNNTAFNQTLYVVNGNVGIGTTSPTRALHVIGSINASDKIYSNVSYSLRNQPSYNSFDDDLVLYLPFSEGNETTDPTVYDRSKYGNNGVCSGVSTGCNWTSGLAGNALFFDATDDFVNVSDSSSLDVSNAFTIEVWAKFKALQDTNIMIVDKSDYPTANDEGYELLIDGSTDATYGFVSNSAGTCSAVGAANKVTTNVWHHLAFVYDGIRAKTYVDGVVDADISCTRNPPNNNADLIIGWNNVKTANTQANGTIDEVRIYKRALLPDEVRTHYFAGMNATLKPYTDMSGKTGINTSTPSATLSVNGTLLVNPLGVTGLFVNPSGNVGIGTTAPTALLNVHVASGTTTALNITNLGTGNTTIINDAQGDTSPFIIDASGNVGIGTTAPGAALEVVGSGNVGINVLTTGSVASPYIDFTPATASKWEVGANYGGEGNFYISRVTGGGNITIPNGNVGIGDTSPDYGLDVVADINSDDCFREAGSQIAGTCASDIRLKQNIVPLTGSLNKLLQLKPVEFEWKPGIENLGGTIRYVEGRQVGLVAQDVEKVLPDLVKEKDGFLSIEYNLGMQMMMINAIQELKAQKDTEISLLRQENDKLKNRIVALEEKIK